VVIHQHVSKLQLEAVSTVREALTQAKEVAIAQSPEQVAGAINAMNAALAVAVLPGALNLRLRRGTTPSSNCISARRAIPWRA